MRSWNKI